MGFMMSASKAVVFMAAMIILLVPHASQAANRLPLLVEQRLSQEFPDQPPQSVSQQDLNGDGIAEYIVEEPGCPARSLCNFRIFANTDEKLIELGRIKAQTVRAGQKRHQGVLELLAFDQPDNDFKYNIYSWTPERRAYERR